MVILRLCLFLGNSDSPAAENIVTLGFCDSLSTFPSCRAISFNYSIIVNCSDSLHSSLSRCIYIFVVSGSCLKKTVGIRLWRSRSCRHAFVLCLWGCRPSFPSLGLLAPPPGPEETSGVSRGDCVLQQADGWVVMERVPPLSSSFMPASCELQNFLEFHLKTELAQ